MFKKYLLLSCAAAMLSACGGGKDLDYGTVIISTPTPTPAPPDFTPDWDFQTADQVDSWEFETNYDYVLPDIVDAPIYVHPSEKVLTIVPNWPEPPCSANAPGADCDWDAVTVIGTLSKDPVNIESGNIYFSLYYPEQHMGNPFDSSNDIAHHLGTQYIVVDIEGRRAMLDTGDGDNWQNSFDLGDSNYDVTVEELPNGSWFHVNIDVGPSPEIFPIDSELDADFDITQVVGFGLRFNFALERPAKIEGSDDWNGDMPPQQYLYINDVAVLPYSGDGPLPTPTPEPEAPKFSTYLPIEDGLPGWSTDGAPNTLAFVSDEMQVTPDWSADDQVMMYVFDAPYDYTNATVTWVVDIPEEYVGAGISFQPYVQQNSGSYSGDFSAWIDASTIVAGENTFEVTFASPPADIQRVGLQMKGASRSMDPASPITIKSVKVPLLPSTVNLPLEESASWSTDGKPNVLSFADGVMNLTPEWSDSDQLAMYVLDQPLDFTGATVEWVVDVPADWVDAGISFQPYIQQNGGSYEGDYSAWFDASTIVEGENTFSVTYDAPPSDVQRIGIQAKGGSRGSDPTSDLVITSASYTLPLQAPSLPIEDGLAGWSDDGKGNALVYADGTIELTPDWTSDDQIAMYVLAESSDFTGAIVKWTVTIPAGYIGAGISLQPYLQQNDGSYTGDYSQWVDASTLVQGVNVLELTFTSPPADIQRIGLQLKGASRTSSPTEPFVINSVTYLVP